MKSPTPTTCAAEPSPSVRSRRRAVEPGAPHLGAARPEQRGDRGQPEQWPWHNTRLYRSRQAGLRRERGDPAVDRMHQTRVTCSPPCSPCRSTQLETSAGSTGRCRRRYANGRLRLLRVAKNPDGTVKINADGTVTMSGRRRDLDGTEGMPGVNSSKLSNLFGTRARVRDGTRRRDPANAIQHALAFNSRLRLRQQSLPASRPPGPPPVNGLYPGGRPGVPRQLRRTARRLLRWAKGGLLRAQEVRGVRDEHRKRAIGLCSKPRAADIPGGSGSDPYPGVGLTSDYMDCRTSRGRS